MAKNSYIAIASGDKKLAQEKMIGYNVSCNLEKTDKLASSLEEKTEKEVSFSAKHRRKRQPSEQV